MFLDRSLDSLLHLPTVWYVIDSFMHSTAFFRNENTDENLLDVPFKNMSHVLIVHMTF